MFKKYWNIFFSARSKKQTHRGLYFLSGGKNKMPRRKKYQKRKKNIFQKCILQASALVQAPKWIHYFSIFILILLSGIYTLLYSDFTTIKTINIYREGALVDINRSYSVVDYVRGSSLVRSDSAALAQRLQRSQSAISLVRINKDFPDTINIYLDSYNPVFQTQGHFILSNGSIVPKKEGLFPDTEYLILSEDVSEFDAFQQKIPPQALQTISEIISETRKNILAFSPEQIFYFLKEREIMIRDSAGTLYIFDLEKNPENQVEQLAIYEKESPTDTRSLMSYIDVRIPDKLFLCPKETQTICLNNLERIYGTIISLNPRAEVSESQQ